MSDELTTLQTRLTEAENALHKLQLGQAVQVYVDQNGERVEYTRADRTDLQSYINELKQQIKACQGEPLAGPLNVWVL